MNMASGGGVLPVPTVAAYGMSKAAAISLTRTLATEVGTRGIRVNAIAPGVIVTSMTTRNIDADDPYATSQFRRRAAEANPMSEAVTPEDIGTAQQRRSLQMRRGTSPARCSRSTRALS